ncbi:hypothetical protein FQA47_022417 [Oryzias melastigma]|uniref:Uncharacterized protein n=1 Tax=Oryzias melastigma TaxID=30732 RepID=A0A834FRF1_ORYME|nr:hypothetical protein FQA47_022417 [Oryzias melastigma]
MNSWRGIKGGLRPAGRPDRLKGASGAGVGPGAAHGHIQTSAADGARGGLDPPTPLRGRGQWLKYQSVCFLPMPCPSQHYPTLP